MTDTRVAADLDPASLENLGMGVPSTASLRALTDAANRRRVRVLELVRREHRGATGAAGVVVSLLDRWASQIQEGRVEARAVLEDPFVSIWSEGVVRGERAIDEVGAIGRLLDLSRCVGLSIETTVETIDGAVHLPGLGGTLIVDGSETTVRIEDGRIDVSGPSGRAVFAGGMQPHLDGAEWRPHQRISTAHGNRALTVILGSDDPAAARVGAAPMVALTDADRLRWSDVLEHAWAMIVARHSKHIAGIQVASRVIVAQRSPDPNRHISSSSADALGVIGLSFTEDIPTFALGIVHETRHALLSAAMLEVELHVPDPTPRFYAGWRADARPVGALLQGACAFSAVTDFWRIERAATSDDALRRRFSLELERWYRHTTDAQEQLGASGLLTTEGRAFLAGMTQLTGDRPDVEPLVSRAVGDMIAEHRVMWRRRVAFGDPIDPNPPTTLTLAWRERLLGATGPGEASPVDRALAGDDLRLALDLACAACVDGGGFGDGLRVARALHHLGDQDSADAIETWIASPSPDIPGAVAAARAHLQSGPAGADDLTPLGEALTRIIDEGTRTIPSLEATR